jgi:hypothetical protein
MPIPSGIYCLGLAALHVLDMRDFHIFSPLKRNIKGPIYLGQVKMLSVVMQWLQQQHPTSFSAKGIHQLICQWDIHLTAHGDYFYNFY